MHCLLIYDIPDDGPRIKIADACLDYGLDRIQYSAFVGELRLSQQDELMLRAQKLLGKRLGKIQLFAINEADWAARREIIQLEKEPAATKVAAPSAQVPADDSNEAI